MKKIAIIPARYASSRFPGKPLALLHGKPMVWHVYEKAVEAIGEACVATDDVRIAREVESRGGLAVMTSAEHRSGTDRIAEALASLPGCYDVVVNVQGDEPLIHPGQITAVCEPFADPAVQIATLGKPFTSMEEIENPNSPKIVTTADGFAMYFSRSAIPYVRGAERREWPSKASFLKHIGLYAYRPGTLAEITALPQSPLEKAESLEQLRWLENGYRVKVVLTDRETVGIDTPADLERAERLFT